VSGAKQKVYKTKLEKHIGVKEMAKSNLNINGKKDQNTGLNKIRLILSLRTILDILRIFRIIFIQNYLREILRKSDLYLHYSNYIIFEKSSFLPALKFILLKISSVGGKIFDGAAEVLNGPEARIAAIQNTSENINSFDGVIERYCGVPP
jgi:hypothetical protein